MIARRTSLLLVLILASVTTLMASAQTPEAENKASRIRFVGPKVGNRISAAAGIPGDPSVLRRRGVRRRLEVDRWRQELGADFRQAARRGHRRAGRGAVRSEHRMGGTGEAWAIRDSDMMGDGIYKSTDAGKTWSNMGLPETGRIGRIVVHPSNPDIVFACVAGPLTGPAAGARRLQNDRRRPALGARRCSPARTSAARGLSMDAHDPRHAVRRHVAGGDAHLGEFSGGPGSGVYVSHDGGTTLDAHRGARPAAFAGGQDRRRRRADQFEARLRPDPDQGPGFDLALRRRRREAGRPSTGSAR